MIKKRFISMLVLLLMAVSGAWATITVTWNNDDITGSGKSFTKDGVTITAGMIDFNQKSFMQGGTFSTTLGNFTKIEVTAMNFVQFSGTDWSGSNTKQTWTGNASSVSFSGNILGMVKMGGNINFVFTIEPVAVTGVTLAPTSATLTLGETETVTLIPTVLPAEATDKSVTWSSSDEAVATVTDGVVTAVAAGTATITVTTTDGAKTATCAVTVAAPAASTYTVTLKEGTDDATSWTIAPAEATTTGVAAGTEVKATYGGAKKVKSVKAKKKAASAEPEPAGPTTVTWNSSNVSDIQFWGGAPDGYDSYTKEGITLRGNAEQCDASWQNWGGGQEGIMFAMNAPGGYTFTAPDGKKFTKIEITATTNDGWYTYAYFGQLESGWPSGEEAADNFNSTLKFTWTGSAASVNLATTLNSFGPSLVSSIEFTLAAGLTSYTLAESTVGMIVGTDGKAYDVADKDNLPSGVTAAGVVVYKNGANGLAIALTDEASMMDWATACGESGAAAHTPTVEGQTWKLPSQEEWTLVKNANSGSSLNSAITNAGGTAIPTVRFDPETGNTTGKYWLSTEGGFAEAARTWGINYYDEIAVDSQDFKTSNNLVRACLAW